MKVAYFQRKPRKHGNFSIEFIFDDVRERLGQKIEAIVRRSPFESKGLARRLANALVAPFLAEDINHVTGDISYVGILLPKRKTIQTIHDCGPLLRTTGLRHWVLKKVWFEYPVRRCAHVTVVSEATKAALLQFVSVDPARLSVIPVAISESFVRMDKPFNSDCPRILQVGTAPNKNVHRLILAIKDTECFLDVIGARDPVAEGLLRAQGTPYRWRSGLAHSDVVNAYAESDIVAFVSTVEGFGMPILEAQAVGRVVLTSDRAPMDGVAGGAACLVNPLDVDSIRMGVRRLVDDPGYRNDLTRKGFANVSRFDPRTVAGQYLELYRRIGANSGGASADVRWGRR